MRKKQVICGLSVVLVVLMASGMAFAQPQGGAQRGQRGQAGQAGQGMRGNMTPEQMQQQMMTRMQEQLGMTEAEMKAIQPLMTKVMDLRREAGGRGGMMGMRGGRGGRGGQQTNAPALTGLAKIQSELQALTESDSASSAAIKAKLVEYRKAREALQQQLTAAQANLIKVLTPKQEAICLMMGYVE